MPSHNCIIITMFSFQGTFWASKRNSLKPQLLPKFQSISFKWWRVPGSNRWPPACKAGALPAELTPHLGLLEVVGQSGLEPPTSRLSVVCSSQLSYWPLSAPHLIQVHLWIFKRLNETPVSRRFSQSLLVESTGIEPVTSCLQGRRSPSWANPPYPGILNCLGTFFPVPSKLNNATSTMFFTLVLTLGRY